jgi:hypothetical protein
LPWRETEKTDEPTGGSFPLWVETTPVSSGRPDFIPVQD